MTWSNLAQALGTRPEQLPGAKAESLKYSSLRALDRAVSGQNVPGKVHASSVSIPGLDSLPQLELKAASAEVAQSAVAQTSAEVAQSAVAQTSAQVAQSAVAHAADVNCSFAAAAETALALCGSLQGLQQLTIDCSDHQQHAVQLRVEAGQQATLVLALVGSETDAKLALLNRLLSVQIGPDAELDVFRWQCAPKHAQLLEHSEFTLARGARLRVFDLNLGAAWSRHVMQVKLAGTESRFQLANLQLGASRQHQDLQLEVQHHAENCQSEMQLRALAADRARLIQRGRIYVAKGADHTDANLQSKSLLLSEHAEIDSKPELEIHADEVKAAHGASIGQLDASALFYLQARGIDRATAKQMLQQAFCEAPFAKDDDKAVLKTLLARSREFIAQSLRGEVVKL